MTFERLWLVIAVLLPAFVALVVPMPAVDLAYQVRAGNEIIAAGTLPGVDTWTFTVAGTPWLDQQWLAQVVLAVLHGVGGWELLAVLRAALVVAMTGSLVGVALARGAAPRTAAILSLAAFAISAMALALRPQLFGIVLFALLLWLVAARARHPRLYWLAPVLVAFWANLHGTFVLGPLLLGYAWLDDALGRRASARSSLLVLATGVAATLLNPFGAGVWTYAAGMGGNAAITGQVTEWQRTSPLRMPGVLFYPSVLVVVALLWRGRASVAPATVLLAAAFLILGAWTERGVVWWALVLVFVLAGTLPAVTPVRVQRGSIVNGVTAAVLAVLMLAALPWWRPADPLAGRQGLLTYAPSALASWVASNAPTGARVVVPQEWGSWFEWAAPGQLYFIDSRFELFPAGVWKQYLALSGPDATAILQRWGAEVLVVAAGEPGPVDGWSEVFVDKNGRVFLRSTAAVR